MRFVDEEKAHSPVYSRQPGCVTMCQDIDHPGRLGSSHLILYHVIPRVHTTEDIFLEISAPPAAAILAL